MKATFLAFLILWCFTARGQDAQPLDQAAGQVPLGQAPNCPCRWVEPATTGAVVIAFTVDPKCVVLDKRVVASPDSSLNKLALSTISSKFEFELMKLHHFDCKQRTLQVGVAMYKPEEMDQ
jgi:hypothetical protein